METNQIENKPRKLIVCQKCKTTFDANLIRCPSCGHNRFLVTIKYALLGLLIAFLLFTGIYTLVKINQIDANIISGFDYMQYQFENLQSSAGTVTSDSANQYDISTHPYYQGKELTASDDLSKVADDYLLYFHQHGCGACNELNTFIKTYVESDDVEILPIYFVTPDTGDPVFQNTMFGENGVTETPTIFRIKNGEAVNSAVGVQSCINLVNKSISDYK